jgi:hypothetical protein
MRHKGRNPRVDGQFRLLRVPTFCGSPANGCARPPGRVANAPARTEDSYLAAPNRGLLPRRPIPARSRTPRPRNDDHRGRPLDPHRRLAHAKRRSTIATRSRPHTFAITVTTPDLHDRTAPTLTLPASNAGRGRGRGFRYSPCARDVDGVAGAWLVVLRASPDVRLPPGEEENAELAAEIDSSRLRASYARRAPTYRTGEAAVSGTHDRREKERWLSNRTS